MIHSLDELKKPLNFVDLFAKTQDIHLEIGVGKGRYLKEIAQDRPDLNFIGLEKSIKWFKKAEEKVHKKLGLNDQVVLIHAYAEELFGGYLEDKSLAAIHILFPDPWPKRRHLPRRIFSTDNIKHFHTILRDKGCIYFATDYLEYFEDVKKLFMNDFVEQFSFKVVEPFAYTTNFQAKYQLENRSMGFAIIHKI
ncbi:hypothetical protein MRY82_00285 [bacterium]|nr:hypothetical protein [bacterium]